jgi:hypothetical protein
VVFNCNTTGVIFGTETLNPYEAPELTPCFLCVNHHKLNQAKNICTSIQGMKWTLFLTVAIYVAAIGLVSANLSAKDKA